MCIYIFEMKLCLKKRFPYNYWFAITYYYNNFAWPTR